MEVNNGGGSLSITELKEGGAKGGDDRAPRKTIAEGTYRAEYRGMKISMEDTKKWGMKKQVRLLFKILKGPFKDTITSFKRSMLKLKDTEQWVVGSKSELAEAIRTISGGNDLNDSHKGKVFIITVKNSKSSTPDPKTGEYRVYDFIETIVNDAVDDEPAAPAPAASAAASAPAAAAPAANTVKVAVQAPAKEAPKTNDALLADLTELSDFEKF